MSTENKPTQRTKKVKTEPEAALVTEIIKDETVIASEVPEPPQVVEEPKVKEPPKFVELPKHESLTDRSPEEKILDYMKDKTSFVRMNDFLKSLYPITRMNEPPVWASQIEGKRLRILLDKLIMEGRISVKNDIHKKLGTHYYPKGAAVTHYHNLASVVIEGQSR